MANITKTGQGARVIAETAVAALSNIVLVAPGPGFANRVRSIVCTQQGGTSVTMRVQVAHSASVQDPTGVTIDLARVRRTAGQESNFQFIGGRENGIIGGDNQQTDINITGNVGDSTETDCVVVADVVKV